MSELNNPFDTTYLRLDGSNDPMTGGLQINVATTTEEALILKTTDDNTTKNLFEAQGSGGASLFLINAVGDVTITGDLTITGDDLFMTTNTANYFLMADGTNYNPTSPTDARTGLGLVAGGAGDIWVEKAGDTMTGALNISLATGNSLIVDTNVLVVDATNDRIGMGTATPSYPIELARTETHTSGIEFGELQTWTLNPASDSSVTYSGSRSSVETTANAINYTSVLIASAPRVFHNGSGLVAETRGINMVTSMRSSGGITLGIGGNFSVTTGAASATGTIADARAGNFQIQVSGANATFTKGAGVYIETPVATGTLTTNYGIYIEDQNTAGTDYAIYTNAGDVRFGGNVGIGTDPEYALEVDNGTSNRIAIEYNPDIGMFGELLLKDDNNLKWSVGASSDGSVNANRFYIYQYTNSSDVAVNTTQFFIDDNGDTTVTGDLTITGDDLFMLTNTANYFLMADGTNYNPTTPAAARTGLGLDAGGAGDIWVEKAGDTMTGDLSVNNAVVIRGKDTGGTARSLLQVNVSDKAVLGNTVLQTNISSVSGSEILQFAASETVFNEGSLALNHRFESNGNTHLLFLDGTNNKIGINTASPTAKLQVLSAVEQLRLEYDASNYASFTTGVSGDLTINATGGDVILSSSNLQVGAYDSGSSAHLSVSSAGANIVELLQRATSNVGTQVNFHKARGAGGALSTVVTGDDMGTFNYYSYDGASYILSVRVIADSEGTISTGVVPARYFVQTMDTAGSLWNRFFINTSEVVINEQNRDSDFRVESDTSANAFVVDAGNDRIGMDVAADSILGKLHIDQSSATGAIPVLYLDQADVSEEIFEIVSTAGVGNAIEDVGAKSLTTTGFIKCTINSSTVYIPFGTIA